MLRPIVIVHHLIWTVYGFWLPNDPRGSGSKAIASDVIAELGALHFGRKRVQPPGKQVRRFYEEAAPLLRHQLLSLTEADRAAIANAFADTVALHRYTCYACAVMPDHVHLLIRKHKHTAEEMMENLKEASRLRLSILRLRPPNHPVWTGGTGWKVFLDTPDDIRRTIPYIEANPTKMGMQAHTYVFVKAYDGWPLHEGYNPRSPYARRLRGEC